MTPGLGCLPSAFVVYTERLKMEVENRNKMNEPDGSLLIRYISGTVSDREKQQIESWQNECETNERTVMQMARIYYEYRKNERISSRDSLRAFNNVQKRIKANRFRIRFRKAGLAAACLLGIFLLSSVLAYWMNRSGEPEVQTVTIMANAGMRTRLSLPDGTVACLNSGSSLSYPVPFDQTERRVILSGEAYFKVTHDREHPFVVSVSGDRMRVKVLGTEFNLQAYEGENEIQTTLVNGLVNLEFVNESGKIYEQQLHPSEKAIYDLGGRKVDIQLVNTLYDTAWMEGKLIFRDSPLPDVLKKLSYFYDVTFEVKDSVLESYCFTGTFKDRQLSQILDYLKISSNIDYQIIHAEADDSEKVERTKVILRKKNKK